MYYCIDVMYMHKYNILVYARILYTCTKQLFSIINYCLCMHTCVSCMYVDSIIIRIVRVNGRNTHKENYHKISLYAVYFVFKKN